MNCPFVLMAAGLLVISVQAYAPIQWLKFPSRGPVLMPRGFDGYGRWFANLPPPQRLTIGAAPDNMSPNMVPYFTAMPDKTIAWDDMHWCIEAGGDKSGDAVTVNRCTGGRDQKWTLIPDGHGRSIIQLENTNMCMDVTDKEGSLTGSDVQLSECASKSTESWKFEESAPLQRNGWWHVMDSPLFQVGFWSMPFVGILLGVARKHQAKTRSVPRRTSTILASAAASRVNDLESQEEFDEVIAQDSLVVIDYMTTFCGPCKLMEPKFAKLSIDYPSVTFCRAQGDKNTEMSDLFKAQGVSSMPRFGFYKQGKEVAMVRGSKLDKLIDAIEEHM